MARTPSQEKWLRFFNDVIYDALAPVYNLLDWWQLTRRALDYIPQGGRVLEVGFGPGKLHAELAQRAEVCAGLDLAWGMCRFTQRRLRKAELPANLARGSVFSLPFPAEAFDVVVSTFAFSGFPEGPDAMREMARVVAPGGSVVLVDIGEPSSGSRMGTFLARVWEAMGDFLYDQPALMREMGLEVITFDEFGPGNHIRAVVGRKA